MQIPPFIARIEFLSATAMGGLASAFQFLSSGNGNESIPNQPPNKQLYHEPPPGVAADYSDNPSVFGQILNGDVPGRSYAESTELLAFADRSPKAKLHALVIPKRHVEDVYSLTPDDANLVRDMHEMGLEILRQNLPRALEENDYIFCFHVPPFNSVDHLHLHVLAPASEMNPVFRNGKYACGARWCVGDLEVIDRLERGEAAVPYEYRSGYLEALLWN